MSLHPFRKFPAFYGTHVSLLRSEQPAIFPCLDRNQSSPLRLIEFFNIYFNISFLFTPISRLVKIAEISPCHVAFIAVPLFRRVRKIAGSDYYLRHVRLPFHMEQLCSHYIDFHEI